MKSKLGQRDYAWSYFELHAKQRMSTFNFYIVISALMTTGLISSLTSEKISLLLSIILGICLMVVSFIFWKLDQRVRFLIKHAEKTLQKLEKDPENDSSDFYTNLFSDEEIMTSSTLSTWKIWNLHLTYSKCFNVLYILFGVLGLIGALLSTCIYLGMSFVSSNNISLISIYF